MDEKTGIADAQRRARQKYLSKFVEIKIRIAAGGHRNLESNNYKKIQPKS